MDFNELINNIEKYAPDNTELVIAYSKLINRLDGFANTIAFEEAPDKFNGDVNAAVISEFREVLKARMEWCRDRITSIISNSSRPPKEMIIDKNIKDSIKEKHKFNFKIK